MSEILIFAGTTEGRMLAERLSAQNVKCIVCVATEYGNELMPDLPGVQKRVGRLSTDEMIELMHGKKIDITVDATHPFATVVSENIRQACGQADVEYIRLKRQTASLLENDNVRIFQDNEACAMALENTKGNILLTTGSKELDIYCRDENVRNRLYVRVLPGEESINICSKAGIARKNIIAMQGPFSQQLNEALIRQFDIKYLVTKESGKAGGLDEKLLAAGACGIDAYLIGSPDHSDGMSLEQVLFKLMDIEKANIQNVNIQNVNIQPKNMELMKIEPAKISLVGIGMGTNALLTLDAKTAIEQADYLIGAERMIEPYNARIEKKAVYMPDDIAEYIADKKGYITILFSGDSGFYSGCKKVCDRLKSEGYADIRVIPGISSISYISSKTGIPWSESEIFSIHGRGGSDRIMGELYDKVIHNERIFLLMSGLSDVHRVAEELQCCPQVEIVLGRNLSYDDESVEVLSPQQCMSKTKEGLYTAIILNHAPLARKLTNSHRDDDFIRGKVPMTKEEVRTISISKLGLDENAVVWDVGSGTGSIAVEIAGYSPKIEVYAIECKDEAVALIKENAAKFKVHNVKICQSKAPQGLEELNKPSHVFIGGSGGELEEIIDIVYSRNRTAKVVVNAVSLETIAQVTALAATLPIRDFEAVTLSVSRSRTVGKYNLMQAENPVTIFSFQFCEK